MLKQPGQLLAKINSSFLCSDKASLMTIMHSGNVEKKYKNGSPSSTKVLIVAAQAIVVTVFMKGAKQTEMIRLS